MLLTQQFTARAIALAPARRRSATFRLDWTRPTALGRGRTLSSAKRERVAVPATFLRRPRIAGDPARHGGRACAMADGLGSRAGAAEPLVLMPTARGARAPLRRHHTHTAAAFPDPEDSCSWITGRPRTGVGDGGHAGAVTPGARGILVTPDGTQLHMRAADDRDC